MMSKNHDFCQDRKYILIFFSIFGVAKVYIILALKRNNGRVWPANAFHSNQKLLVEKAPDASSRAHTKNNIQRNSNNRNQIINFFLIFFDDCLKII